MCETSSDDLVCAVVASDRVDSTSSLYSAVSVSLLLMAAISCAFSDSSAVALLLPDCSTAATFSSSALLSHLMIQLARMKTSGHTSRCSSAADSRR